MIETVGSLFSGIGGWDLAARQIGLRTTFFAEADAFRRLVLAENWPGVPIYEDICQVGTEAPQADVYCASFPCSDISTASGRPGDVDGDRTGLWREVIRLLRLHRPAYLVMENVPNLRTKGYERVLLELAACGYDAEWDCVPASFVGAPHVRDRIWIVAYPNEVVHGDPWRRVFDRRFFASLTDERQRAHWDGGFPGDERVDDGLPGRVDRCAALGDSLVPVIARSILEAVVRFDSESSHRRDRTESRA